MPSKSRKNVSAHLLQLKRLAPSIAVSVTRMLDESHRWDGDGPDPRCRGYYPYDVDICTKAIADGEIVEGTAGLGGSYFKANEPIGDLHGYLPQKLEEALADLKDSYPLPYGVLSEVAAALAYLDQVMAQG